MTPPSPDSFKDAFEQRFYDRRQDIADLTPKPGEATGNKTNLLETTYDIDVRNHDSFFDAYTAALKEAFVGHVVENQPLVAAIDDIYDESSEKIDK